MRGAERFSYRNLKLNMKILLIYFMVLAVFILFSFWLYNDYTLNMSKNKAREYSEQVLSVQESSIENTVNGLNNISRIIIANPSVQNFLKSVDENYTVQSKEVFSQIMTYMDIYPVAKSITIYYLYAAGQWRICENLSMASAQRVCIRFRSGAVINCRYL